MCKCRQDVPIWPVVKGGIEIVAILALLTLPLVPGPRMLLPAAMASPSSTAGSELSPSQLMDLPIDDLMNVKVTSAEKKEQKVTDVPAAIFVLTSDDLRRSGASTLPDALRLVPGLHVARIDANKWAISARGFNDRFANKMLVLVDGRSIYTTLFSGVFWETQDIPFEDIERIEVIRDPAPPSGERTRSMAWSTSSPRARRRAPVWPCRRAAERKTGPSPAPVTGRSLPLRPGCG